MAQESVRSNPFYHSGPVTGERFYNRQEELARLLGLLGTTPPTSVALHGEERIGKSSLLRQLCEVAAPEFPQRHLVYLDLQRVFSLEDFLRRVLEALNVEGETYGDLEGIVLREKYPVVLCLDEFGKVLANSAFDANFYDFLRSLTQTGRLALVISTLRSLAELEVPSGADVSRFFNVFRPFPLGPFPPEAARKLVEAGPFTAEEVNWVLQSVAQPNHPYHLQLLGARLFEAKRAGWPCEEALRAYRECLGEIEGARKKAAADGTWPEIAASVSFGISVLSMLLMMIFLQPFLVWVIVLSFLAGIVFSIMWSLRRKSRR